MSDGTHRCRRSCETRVPRNRAFCPACWRTIPHRVQSAIYRSWAKQGVSGEHAELLMAVEDALEGDRPWEAVA